jgi:hypothetical protein
VSEVVVQVDGIDDSDPREGEPFLLLQVGDFFGFTQAAGVLATFKELGVKQSRNVRNLDGAVRGSSG